MFVLNKDVPNDCTTHVSVNKDVLLFRCSYQETVSIEKHKIILKHFIFIISPPSFLQKTNDGRLFYIRFNLQSISFQTSHKLLRCDS